MEQTKIEEKAEEILQTKGSMTFCAKGCGYTEKVKELIAIGLAEGRKEKWHDLRKNPNDLPDNGRCVLVKDKSRKEYDIACLCRSKPDSDFWSYERFTTRVNDNYVVAWCELPKFEE